MSKQILFIKKLLIIVLIFSVIIAAKTELTVGIIKDGSISLFDAFENNIKKDVNDLHKGKYSINYEVLSAEWQKNKGKKYLKDFMENKDIDIIISLGLMSSHELSKFPKYSKPSIAANILSVRLQGLPKNKQGSSGINNFTYIEDRYVPENDLLFFYRLFSYKHVAILAPKQAMESFSLLNDFFVAAFPDNLKLKCSVFMVDEDIKSVLAQFPDNIDAVYVLPLFRLSPKSTEDLFCYLNDKGIPSFTAIGNEYLGFGATAGLYPSSTLEQSSRKIALNIYKTVEDKKNFKELSVKMDTSDFYPILNVKSMFAINRFPDWELLDESRFFNITEAPDTRKLSLRSVILEALANNLNLKIAEKNIDLAKKDIALADSSFLPSIPLDINVTELSQTLVDSSMGQFAKNTFSGKISLSQVLFSEPLLANSAINNLLKKYQEQYKEGIEQDIIFQACLYYIDILLAKSQVDMAYKNLEIKRKNFAIAKEKKSVGQRNSRHVNRWESEVNVAKIDFYNSITELQLAKYKMNEFLDRPLEEEFSIKESEINVNLLVREDDVLSKFFNNIKLPPGLMRFFKEELDKNFSDLQRMQTAISVQNRQKISHENSLFMPHLNFDFTWSKALSRRGLVEKDSKLFGKPSDDPSWVAGVNLNYPIFDGGQRLLNVDKANLQLEKLEYDRRKLKNSMDFLLLGSIQQTITSWHDINLAKNAFLASEKTFNIIQDSYEKNLSNIVDLLYAQEQKLLTEQMVLKANYMFLVNYLKMGRYVGSYYFLMDQDEKKLLETRLQEYLKEGEK